MELHRLLGFAFVGLSEFLIVAAVVIFLLFLFPRLQATYHTFRSLYYRSGGHTEEALAAEEKVGRILADSLLANMPLDSSQSDKDFVSSVATSLLAHTGTQGYSFRFRLVRSQEANAFALPGGFVFVTKPLVELCQRDSDEMAFVLAHEMGHVVKSHVTNRMVDGLLLSLATNMVIGGGRWLAELARKYVLEAMTSAYSRDQEFEADRYATRLLKRADFDAEAGARMLQKLRGDKGDTVSGGYFASHPSIEDRIASIRKCIE